MQRAREPAQAIVEAALASIVLTAVLVLVISIGWWVYAQNVVSAAAQEGARIASAPDGDTGTGQAIAQRLLAAELGAGARNVRVSATSDSQSVEVSVSGSWPVFAGAGVEIGVPVGATSRMLKDRWQ